MFEFRIMTVTESHYFLLILSHICKGCQVRCRIMVLRPRPDMPTSSACRGQQLPVGMRTHAKHPKLKHLTNLKGCCILTRYVNAVYILIPAY